MAALIETSHRSKRSYRSLRIDMTPMVDLGFLLITFFIFSSSMGEPKAMLLYTPKEGGFSNVGKTNALTVLLGADDRVYVYTGDWNTAFRHGNIRSSSYSVYNGVGMMIRERLRTIRSGGGDPSLLTLMIKPSEGSSYGNMVDVMDEIFINNIKRYSVSDPLVEEQQFLEAAH